jgi:hypothetical protein
VSGGGETVFRDQALGTSRQKRILSDLTSKTGESVRQLHAQGRS